MSAALQLAFEAQGKCAGALTYAVILTDAGTAGESMSVLVTGSLHLVGAVLTALKVPV